MKKSTFFEDQQKPTLRMYLDRYSKLQRVKSDNNLLSQKSLRPQQSIEDIENAVNEKLTLVRDFIYKNICANNETNKIISQIESLFQICQCVFNRLKQSQKQECSFRKISSKKSISRKLTLKTIKSLKSLDNPENSIKNTQYNNEENILTAPLKLTRNLDSMAFTMSNYSKQLESIRSQTKNNQQKTFERNISQQFSPIVNISKRKTMKSSSKKLKIDRLNTQQYGQLAKKIGEGIVEEQNKKDSHLFDQNFQKQISLVN